jgi:hypothetical protein
VIVSCLREKGEKEKWDKIKKEKRTQRMEKECSKKQKIEEKISIQRILYINSIIFWDITP